MTMTNKMAPYGVCICSALPAPALPGILQYFGWALEIFVGSPRLQRRIQPSFGLACRCTCCRNVMNGRRSAADDYEKDSAARPL